MATDMREAKQGSKNKFYGESMEEFKCANSIQTKCYAGE